MGNSRGHARDLKSLSECSRMMVLSESVKGNEACEEMGNVWLLTGAPDDAEVLVAFCIKEDGLKHTSFRGVRVRVAMYTNLIVLLSFMSCTDVTFMNSLLKSFLLYCVTLPKFLAFLNGDQVFYSQ